MQTVQKETLFCLKECVLNVYTHLSKQSYIPGEGGSSDKGFSSETMWVLTLT